MTRPLGPRDAFRRFAEALKAQEPTDRESAALSDKEISSFVNDILRSRRASINNLGDIVDIQQHMYKLNPDQQELLTEKFEKIIVSIFPCIEGCTFKKTAAIKFLLPLIKDIESEHILYDLFTAFNQIPEEKWELVAHYAQDLYKITENAQAISNYLETLRAIPIEKIETVVNALIQFPDLIRKTAKDWEVLQALGNLPEEKIMTVAKFAQPLLEGTNEGRGKAKVLTELGKIPEEKIPIVMDHASPLIQSTGTRSGFVIGKLLATFHQIPEEEIKGFLQLASPLLEGTKDDPYFQAVVLGELRRYPKEERQKIIDLLIPKIKDLMHLIKDFHQLRERVLSVAFFLSPEDREKFFSDTLERIISEKIIKWSDIFAIAFEEEKVKANSCAHLEKILETSESSEDIRDVAEFVIRNPDLLGLHMEHPLMQKAIQLYTLSEDPTDPKNPFIMFRNLKELSQKEVSYTPPEYEVEGETVTFDLKTFQSGSVQEVFRKDLPEVKPDALQELTKDLDGRLGELGAADREKVLEAIEKLTVSFKTDSDENLILDPETGEPIEESLSLDALKAGSLESSTLINLLSSEGDPIDITRAYFFVIISYIQSLSNELTGEELLTPREKALIQMGTLITHCGTGKKDGIFRYYHSLVPDDYKISFVQPTDVPEEQRVKKVVQGVVESELAKQFSEVFIQDLLRVEGPVKEPPHQVLYLKNLIGPIVGLPHNLTFDLHTGVLYDDLIVKSREEVLDGFYQLFTADGLVKALQRDVVNRITTPGSEADKTLYSDIEKMLPGVEGIWGLDEDSNMVLTPVGALALLKQAGYIKT